MRTENKPAIVVIGFNRLQSIRRLLQSITNATYEYTDIPLIISIDRADDNDDLVRYVNDFEWKHGPKKVRLFEERQGLREHMLLCGDLSAEYGAVIFLEDDVVVAPDFYQYFKKTLEFYDEDERIAGVALYSYRYNGYAKLPFEPLRNEYDAYIAQFSVSWGMGWSKKQWQKFRQWYELNKNMPMTPRDDMPEQIHRWKGSWNKFFAHYLILEEKYYVIPYQAFSTCFADRGDHTGKDTSTFQTPLFLGKKEYTYPMFKEAIRYNIFFELDPTSISLNLQHQEKLCFNLNGNRSIMCQQPYMITTKELPYYIVQSYGLRMWPMELNILYEIEGNDIFLYDLTRENTNNFKGHQERIYSFLFRFIEKRTLKKYLFEKIKAKIGLS